MKFKLSAAFVLLIISHVCTAARLARDISSVEEKQSDELRDNFFSTLNEDQKTILNRLIYNIKSAKSLAGKTFGVKKIFEFRIDVALNGHDWKPNESDDNDISTSEEEKIKNGILNRMDEKSRTEFNRNIKELEIAKTDEDKTDAIKKLFAFVVDVSTYDEPTTPIPSTTPFGYSCNTHPPDWKDPSQI